MKTRTLALNERGSRIGETHQRAKFTDDEVDLVLYLRGEGLTYDAIAAKWDEPGHSMSASQVRKICKGQVRAQVPTSYKSVAK